MKRWRRRRKQPVNTGPLSAEGAAALQALEEAQEHIGGELVRATHSQYGGLHYDALGLFVQWLAEQVHRAAPATGFGIRMYSIAQGSQVSLEVYSSLWFGRQWQVEHLNRLLRSEPRGGLLRSEIAYTIKALQEHMEKLER